MFLSGEFGAKINPLPFFLVSFFILFQDREQVEFHNLFLVHIMVKIYEVVIYQPVILYQIILVVNSLLMVCQLKQEHLKNHRVAFVFFVGLKYILPPV